MPNWTYDLITDVGQARLIMPDRAIGATNTAGDAIYSDEEWQGFLALEGGDVRMAAALGLETAASDTVLLMKVIQLGVFRIEGDRPASALLKRATMLREQSSAADAAEGGLVDFAELVLDPASERQRIWNQALRRQD
jgi:hypothetical protein